MPRTFAGVQLLTVLMPLPGKAVAGPPEGVSRKMVLARDRVSEALLKYRRESDPRRRLALLTDLAEVRDPRIAVALGQALHLPRAEVRVQAAFGILFHQSGEKGSRMMTGREALTWAREWWAEREADLRRRAKQLPS